MSAQRPCEACGGTGHPGTVVDQVVGIFFGEGPAVALCPACAGRGWQSDLLSDKGEPGQPRRDALADAETLQLVWSDLCGWNVEHSGILMSMEGGNLIDALTGFPFVLLTEMELARWGRRSARAAFGAVPGLREEVSK